MTKRTHERPKQGRGAGQEQRRQQTEIIENRKSTKDIDVEAIKEGMDDILDDIDEVLEQNAQEFINAYVQKGGQ